MRLSFVVVAATCVLGCGSSSPAPDAATSPDLSVKLGDLSAQVDVKVVTPFNMPGQVDCYTGPKCTTTGADPVCCDAKGDGGYTDTCVASAGACLAMDPQAKTFQCGQAADCASGMVCCGSVGMSTSGTPFLSSTTCATSCPSSDTQLCVTVSECRTTGVQCVGESISGRDVGLCK